ncbi:hypothetical protein DERP_011169 [Dermatophagoides pteronyssinus]|uniref:Uncharacterized protein n=1 Tax=Dermatophagoides pteronyssinus TaxID=6956 RepID=A0ABQ8JCU2_DERPT|nr:hypothetical protein DERP_011169 [Dermatophagoides pteronyssinus]
MRFGEEYCLHDHCRVFAMELIYITINNERISEEYQLERQKNTNMENNGAQVDRIIKILQLESRTFN